MKAYFKSLKWNKGSRELVQGVKGNRTPYNVICGGNGSFICNVPAELILTVTTEDGRIISRDIIRMVRGVNGWVRLTQNRVDALEQKLKKVDKMELDERDYVANLTAYVAM